jgi:serine/threonine-protein kinase
MKLPVGVGDRIASKYRVEQVLGVGGMGFVVAATHLQLHELRAIKLMLPQVAERPELTTRFLREAQAVARLHGEHVARVHDVGQLEDGLPFMVMEYVAGDDLAAVSKARGPLPVPEAVTYVLQTCVALAEAHRQGIVHRDIKPSNLFLTRGTDGLPSVKVIDFGIAKTKSSLTEAGVILGTPLYMPPEQLHDTSEVDARADLWALGVVLYELVSGRTPFKAPDQLQLFAQITETIPAPPSQHRPGLPPALDAVILRCLEKDRERRYPTVAELAEALAPFAPSDAASLPARVARVLATAEGGAAAGAPPSASPAEAASVEPPATASIRMGVTVTTAESRAPAAAGEAVGPAPGALGRRRIFGAAAGAMLVGALGLAIFGARFWRGHEGGDPGPAQAPVAASPPETAAPPAETAPLVTAAPAQTATAAEGEPPAEEAPSASAKAPATKRVPVAKPERKRPSRHSF